MNTEFMTADTNLPPCLPLPGAMLGLPVSSTAKVMYARLLGEIYTAGTEDINGLLLRVRREIGAPNRIYVLIPRS